MNNKTEILNKIAIRFGLSEPDYQVSDYGYKATITRIKPDHVVCYCTDDGIYLLDASSLFHRVRHPIRFDYNQINSIEFKREFNRILFSWTSSYPTYSDNK